MLTLFESGDLRVVLMQTAEALPLLTLFSKVAEEHTWNLEGQLSDYPEQSRHFALIKGGQVIGGVKLVLGSDRGLPVSRVWPEMRLAGRSDVAELAFLAFSGDRRGSLDDLWTVTVEMWRYCVFHGVREVWAELTPRNLRLYNRLGWPFQAMGELRNYLGEASFPCKMLVDDARQVVAERAGASGRFHDVELQGKKESPYASVPPADTASGFDDPAH